MKDSVITYYKLQLLFSIKHKFAADIASEFRTNYIDFGKYIEFEFEPAAAAHLNKMLSKTNLMNAF